MNWHVLLPLRLRGEDGFRWRGGSVSRLESLSDAVFAVALSLLVVGLQAPSSAADLVAGFWQFPAFALCFAFLAWLWHGHYLFHRRFGFEDPLTVALNCAFLFCILFYLYPLKFLAQALVTAPLSGQPPPEFASAGPTVMRIYAAGFVGIFLFQWLLYRRAWTLRDAIQLDLCERDLTRCAMRGHAVCMGIGLLSLAVGILLPEQPQWTGLTFFLLGPAMAWNGWRTGVTRTRHLARAALESRGAGQP